MGVVRVATREENQAIALAVGRKCRKRRMADSLEVLHTPTAGNAVQTRRCTGAVHQIYLVLNYFITEVHYLFRMLYLPT